jgi:anaerobic C4-dicarboxylate transporter DcuA
MPPRTVLGMILAVVTAASTMQAAGGLDYLVTLAERALRIWPAGITIVAPIVAYVFTFAAGTGHIVYALLPVIAEVSRKAGVRPERPLSIATIASQQAITASPISAATVALSSVRICFKDANPGRKSKTLAFRALNKSRQTRYPHNENL